VSGVQFPPWPPKNPLFFLYLRDELLLRALERHSGRVNKVAVPATKSCATWIGIKRDPFDDALVPLNADLDQNSDPEVAQGGRHLDA
jgi:hypothetical protein